MNYLTTDLYELTMSQTYFDNKMQNVNAYFDVTFRKSPDGAAFAIANGISEIIEFIKDFHFTKEDISYLKSLGKFSDDFLNYLETLKFNGDVWAVADG